MYELESKGRGEVVNGRFTGLVWKALAMYMTVEKSRRRTTPGTVSSVT